MRLKSRTGQPRPSGFVLCAKRASGGGAPTDLAGSWRIGRPPQPIARSSKEFRSSARGPWGLKQLTLKTENKQRMKSTLVAVALVLTILYGLKAFTRAVARPIERAPVTCAKAQDSTYLMPYAMKLLNGGSLKEVAAELMQQSDAMAAAQTDELAPPARTRYPSRVSCRKPGRRPSLALRERSSPARHHHRPNAPDHR